MISYSVGKGKWEISQGSGLAFRRILCYGVGRAPKGGTVGHILRKEVKPMRVTLHIGIYMVTITVKRRNRHPGR